MREDLRCFCRAHAVFAMLNGEVAYIVPYPGCCRVDKRLVVGRFGAEFCGEGRYVGTVIFGLADE